MRCREARRREINDSVTFGVTRDVDMLQNVTACAACQLDVLS